MKKFSILALSATIITAPAFAETTVYQTIPSTTPSVELSTQFSEATDLLFAFDDTQNLQAVVMTDSQMQETEGKVAPVYALGVFTMSTGRFIATRHVSRNIAANAARSGCNVMCYGTSQQAKSLANQAYGRGNVTRHGPSGHQKHVDYSYYQPTVRKMNGMENKGHIFYGDRYRR
ncbi:hypothetical protein ACSF86_00290 [Moraxella bovoculi]|uniref:hypothetical protein n=1 Tax=Moraxella bovoculi TaxID=386891 RepID=UPI003F50D108